MKRSLMSEGFEKTIDAWGLASRPAPCIQDGDLGIWCAAYPSVDRAPVAESDDGSVVPVEPGMLIEAQGVVMAGGYAPLSRARSLRILGKVPLPEPQPLLHGSIPT